VLHAPRQAEPLHALHAAGSFDTVADRNWGAMTAAASGSVAAAAAEALSERLPTARHVQDELVGHECKISGVVEEDRDSSAGTRERERLSPAGKAASQVRRSTHEISVLA
jgi:hypothetical protein